MRFRMFKNGNPLRRKRDKSQRYAWLPKRLHNGTWIWLEPYTRTRNDYYGYGRHG